MTLAPPPALADHATDAALDEVARLIRRLHVESIRYCHWKSNQHLPASLLGATDLDVLVDRRDAQRLTRVLSRTSFRRLLTPARRSYPAVESYVGADAATGTLLHLHLHYQLTVGEKHLKGYRLPWEELLLATRRLDQTAGVYVADPNLEFLLLVIRAALKLRVRDWILRGLGRPYVTGNTLREWRWLAERVDPERLAGFTQDLVGEQSSLVIRELLAAAAPSLGQLVRFRRSAVPPLREYRTYGALGARWRRWSREGARRWSEAASRRFGALVSTRRGLPQGGLVVAFIGADGSGKSTLTRAISQWLSPLVNVVTIYFGTGQGPASTLRRVLEGVASLVRGATKASRPAAHTTGRGSGSSALRTVGELLWVWSVARERRSRVAKARRAWNRGMIVLCDRLPTQQVGIDGPRLAHWLHHPSWIRRAVARRELAAIRMAERLRPDLIVKLTVTPQVALQRKPETPPALLHKKLHALEQLQVGMETRVLQIDATAPLEQVLLEVKRALWNSL